MYVWNCFFLPTDAAPIKQHTEQYNSKIFNLDGLTPYVSGQGVTPSFDHTKIESLRRFPYFETSSRGTRFCNCVSVSID